MKVRVEFVHLFCNYRIIEKWQGGILSELNVKLVKTLIHVCHDKVSAHLYRKSWCLPVSCTERGYEAYRARHSRNFLQIQRWCLWYPLFYLRCFTIIIFYVYYWNIIMMKRSSMNVSFLWWCMIFFRISSHQAEASDFNQELFRVFWFQVMRRWTRMTQHLLTHPHARRDSTYALSPFRFS